MSPPIYRTCRYSLPLVFDGPPHPIASSPYCRQTLGEFGLGLLGWFIPRGTSPALFPSLSFHYSVDCCVRYRAAPRRRRGGDDGGYRIVTWGGRSYLARWRPALSSSLPLLSFILLLSSSPPFPLCRINHPERMATSHAPSPSPRKSHLLRRQMYVCRCTFCRASTNPHPPAPMPLPLPTHRALWYLAFLLLRPIIGDGGGETGGCK